MRPRLANCAFFFWMQENRERIKKPGMGIADLAKAARIEWQNLSDKSKWEKMAEDDKNRYEKELKLYRNQL
uniref:HMG box domain-containing protein n=1 Tax=Panagrolaimus davidi TaxID=227884 RepID=A0A914PFV7_9BILA